MHAEFVVAGLMRMLRSRSPGPASVAHAALFEHARPAHHREYARVFGGVERFEQAATGITFDRNLLDRPQLNQHPELYLVLRAEAERALERMTEGLGAADQLRRYLLARPPSRIPDPSTAARDLGMSERSLRRRLAAESTSYRDLVRAILETHADHMLRDPKLFTRGAANALGFADAGQFPSCVQALDGPDAQGIPRATHGRPLQQKGTQCRDPSGSCKEGIPARRFR